MITPPPHTFFPVSHSEYGYVYYSDRGRNFPVNIFKVSPPGHIYRGEKIVYQPSASSLGRVSFTDFVFCPLLSPYIYIAPIHTSTKISPPPYCLGVEDGPFTLTGSKRPTKRAVKAGSSLKVTFALTRWAAAYPYAPPARRELAFKNTANGTWENYDVAITLPGQGVTTLKGRPRVVPFIPKRKNADVANNALITWDNVPMLVGSGSKNYTRKFVFSVKVDKTFVGPDITFAALATGPQEGWRRRATVTVPITAAHK